MFQDKLFRRIKVIVEDTGITVPVVPGLTDEDTPVPCIMCNVSEGTAFHPQMTNVVRAFATIQYRAHHADDSIIVVNQVFDKLLGGLMIDDLTLRLTEDASLCVELFDSQVEGVNHEVDGDQFVKEIIIRLVGVAGGTT